MKKRWIVILIALALFMITTAFAQTPDYALYIEGNQGIPFAKEDIVIEHGEFILPENSSTNDEDYPVIPSQGELKIVVNVPETALYRIKVCYQPLLNAGGEIQRTLLINGTLPFKEAEGIQLTRLWKDQNPPQDVGEEIIGNQSFPSQIEAPSWRLAYIEDPLGYEKYPFLVKLEKGENTISLLGLQEKMLLSKLVLEAPKSYLNYEDYIKSAENEGYNKIENAEIKFQAERTYIKSDPSLYPINDRSSALTEPNHPSFIVLNSIGGGAWNAPGEWISWKIDVPESGLYRLGLRLKQSTMRGMYVSRKLLVNGEIPFEEANDLRFYHKSGFQFVTLSLNRENPEDTKPTEEIWLKLEKGENIIALEGTLGAIGEILRDVDKLTVSLNNTYRQIIAITGTNPDVNRNYQLYLRIPELKDKLVSAMAETENVYKRLTALTGVDSERSAALNRLINVLFHMNKGEEQISPRLAAFKECVTGIGKAALDFKDQPLTIDYFILMGKSNPKVQVNGNIIDNLKFSVGAFIGSFTNDYNRLGDQSIKKTDKRITVWVGLGRDQFQVISRLINESFTPKTGIEVDLKLISPDVLLPATMTGTGPDVAIQIGSNAPINFAFRGAAKNLKEYSDFESVAERFHKASLQGLYYKDGCFGLPDQMSFPVLFYRKDILDSMNLSPPDTWEDLIKMIPELQKENMTIYLDTAPPQTLGVGVSLGAGKPLNTVFLSRLYQLGGAVYDEDLTRCLFDEELANEAFRWWTQFYTQHGFEKDIDFVTRFRLGETPIGMVDLNTYNALAVSAPEIKNQWRILPVPGTTLEDGSVSRLQPCVIGASMILKNIAEKNGTEQESWEFLKWWTDEETQLTYARDMESVLGPSGRYMVSNMAAFSKLAWPNHVREALNTALSNLVGLPEAPGGYITGRYLNNAFLSVITDYENPSDTLFENAQLINEEITMKRIEFGLEGDEAK